MRKIHNNDPRPLRIRYKTTCKKCGKRLPVNEIAYYWPSSVTILCTVCGEPEFRQFLSSVCDENVFNGTGNPYYD